MECDCLGVVVLAFASGFRGSGRLVLHSRLTLREAGLTGREALFTCVHVTLCLLAIKVKVFRVRDVSHLSKLT